MLDILKQYNSTKKITSNQMRILFSHHNDLNPTRKASLGSIFCGGCIVRVVGFLNKHYGIT